jgi:hypothetical protein
MRSSSQNTDFAYWSRMSFWTIEQSTALLIGADPDAILEGSSLTASCPAGTRERYQKIFRLLNSHVRMSGIGSNLSPTEIIEWALHANVNPPKALVDAVRAQGPTLIETRTAARGGAEYEALKQEKPLGERERSTLLRIIIGMAIRGYSYDPEAARSDIPKAITDDLSELGLECSGQTVREKLKEARAFLPGDWKVRRDGEPN